MRKLLLFLPLIAIPSLVLADDIEALMERSAWKRARAAVDDLAKTRPDDARTHYLRSRVQMAFRDPGQALVHAEKAVALEPNNANYHNQLGQVVGYMAQRSGKLKAFSLARRYRKELETALELDPKLNDARWGLMEFYSIAPGIVGGDDKKAKAMAEEIGKLDPVRGLLAQGQLAARAKNEAEALAFYQRAVDKDPSDYSARVTLARSFAQESQKKYDLVEKHARAALELDPLRPGAYNLLAGLYAHQERWEELDRVVSQADREIPGNLTPVYQAGRILLEDQRHLDRAERYFRQYLEVEPEGSSVPSLAHAHWRLSNVLEKLGRKPEALAELETSLKLDPNLDDARKDLKRLKRG